jgi:hypothetical protein
MVDLSRLKAAATNYATVVDDLYGHYLDSTSGFIANVRRIEETQNQSYSSLVLDANLDNSLVFYGHGDPNDPSNRMLHRTTQGEYKRRNTVGGRNHLRAAQLLIVLIFEYWESAHRAKIASALGLEEHSSLKVPIMGDLRLLRQDVVHHRSIVRSETARKLTVIEGICSDIELSLGSEDVELLVHNVKEALDHLVVNAGGNDPELRKVWHVQ